jgi:hypothetical protein
MYLNLARTVLFKKKTSIPAPIYEFSIAYKTSEAFLSFMFKSKWKLQEDPKTYTYKSLCTI